MSGDPFRRAEWGIWVLAFVVVVLILLQTGCAPLPKCPQAEARVLAAQDGGMFIGFTPQAAAQWMDAIREEALGRCAFEKKGEV